jgi:hypothetical protein
MIGTWSVEDQVKERDHKRKMSELKAKPAPGAASRTAKKPPPKGKKR